MMSRVRRWTSACAALVSLALGGACSASSDGGGSGAAGGGNPGCTTAPNCGSCQACFDNCLCSGSAAETCLLQCTNGVGGAGGQAGAASGGTGGGVGGAGGTGGGTGGSGATGGSGGFSCTQVSTNNASCDACIHGSCCDQITACFTSSMCAGLNQCLGQFCANSGDPSACAQQYCGQYLGAANEFNAMAQCFANNCAGAC